MPGAALPAAVLAAEAPLPHFSLCKSPLSSFWADQGQQPHELFGWDIFGNMCLEKCIPGVCSTVSSQQHCAVSTLVIFVKLVNGCIVGLLGCSRFGQTGRPFWPDSLYYHTSFICPQSVHSYFIVMLICCCCYVTLLVKIS